MLTEPRGGFVRACLHGISADMMYKALKIQTQEIIIAGITDTNRLVNSNRVHFVDYNFFQNTTVRSSK